MATHDNGPTHGFPICREKRVIVIDPGHFAGLIGAGVGHRVHIVLNDRTSPRLPIFETFEFVQVRLLGSPQSLTRRACPREEVFCSALIKVDV